MKVITMYTIPGFDYSFNSTVKVFEFLKKESLNMPVDVESCMPLQIIRCERILQYRSQIITWLVNLCESSIAGYDERGASYLVKPVRDKVVNTLIRKNIYLGVMNANLLPLANLCEQEFIEKYSYYELLLDTSRKVVFLYSEEDVKHVVMPSIPEVVEPITQETIQGKGVKFKPEHYMKMYFTTNVLYRPSMTMLKGLIKFHLDKQYIKSKENYEQSFKELLDVANLLRDINPKITQQELYNELRTGMRVVKQIKKIWKDEE
jgi:hypothetical protein